MHETRLNEMNSFFLPRTAVCRLSALAAWGLLALASLFTGAAEAQVRTLASNLDQPTNAATRAFLAQAFTTGDNPGGYNLTSVTINVANTGDFSGGIRVWILSPDDEGNPGATVASLITPDSISDGNLTFMVDEHFQSKTRYLALEANETYFIGFPDRSGQVANSCRRVTVRTPFLLTTLYQDFSTLFSRFDTGHQVIAIWDLSFTIVVFRPQFLQHSLDSITIVGSVVIPFMQN